MQEAGAHDCTDITGFGLIGHATQLAQNNEGGIVTSSDSVSLLPGMEELAMRTAVLHRRVEFPASFPYNIPAVRLKADTLPC